MTFTSENFFGFLVTVYNRVGHRDKFSHKKFRLGRPRFNARVT